MSTPAALSDMDKTFPAWDAAAVEADLKAAAGACRRLDRRARKALTSVSLAARAPTINQAGGVSRAKIELGSKTSSSRVTDGAVALVLGDGGNRRRRETCCPARGFWAIPRTCRAVPCPWECERCDSAASATATDTRGPPPNPLPSPLFLATVVRTKQVLTAASTRMRPRVCCAPRR